MAKRKLVLNIVISVVFFVISLLVNFWAGNYATDRASNAVTDIILSNTKVFNVDGIFVYGSMALGIFIVFLCIKDPKKIPFTLKSIALFLLIRSVFVSLTHIGPFPDHVAGASNTIKSFTLGGDLFFSGHTGLPFLMALSFWETMSLRIFFIVSSIAFGVIVLVGHLHYSIDVLSAFFITYSIFHLAEYFFKGDRDLFLDMERS